MTRIICVIVKLLSWRMGKRIDSFSDRIGGDS